MTNENQNTSGAELNAIPLGARLQAAREALGLERKDAAAQLRLNEKIILMMENDNFSSDVPATFARGYIRSYGKLLQIPESEIKSAIDPILPPPSPVSTAPMQKPVHSVTSSNYFMKIFTALIILTLVGLVGAWWYSHSTTPSVSAENQQISLPEGQSNATLPMTATSQLPPTNAAPNSSTAAPNANGHAAEPAGDKQAADNTASDDEEAGDAGNSATNNDATE